MFHLQRSSFTYFSHQSQPTTANPNPNAYLSFSQPVIPSALASDPALHPPGTDPYANFGAYQVNHVGFVSQPQYYEDPNAGSQSWVVKEAGAIKYDVAITSLNEKSLMPTSLNSSGSSHWTNQPLVNDVPQTITKLSVAGGQELETKTQKLLNGGAAVDSVRVCTICNVACNSQEVFNRHLTGKKHAAQAGVVALNGIGPYIAAIRTQNNSTWKKGPKKTKVVQSAWCEVCKINCNSNDVYVRHLSGKKHQKNLENFVKPNTGTSASTSIAAPASTNPTIGPIENPVANRSKGDDLQRSQKRPAQSQLPQKDLETKKRKIVEGGAAFAAVKICTICNVVCNSQKVFNSHLTGQKHASMVKKQTEAGMATTAP